MALQNVRLCEAKRYSSYNNRWSDHMVSVAAGKLRFQLQGDAPLETPAPVNDGRWHHAVTTVGPGGQRLLVDGQLIATGKLSRRTKSSNRLGLDLGPGGGQGTVVIDDFQVFGRSLAESGIVKSQAWLAQGPQAWQPVMGTYPLELRPGLAKAGELQNPSFARLVQKLRAAGVSVFDPLPPIIRPGETRCLAQDTHWTPQWMDEVAHTAF